MKRLDPAGTLAYLGARLNPFSNLAWARHRPTGLFFRVNVRDAVGRQILRHQGYEAALTEWLLGCLKAAGPGALFVDVGANLGWYTLRAAQLPEVAQVVAIEPESANQQLLRANLDRNALDGKVRVLACAAGAASGSATLHRYKSSNMGRHSIAVNHGRGGAVVPVEPLDVLLDQLRLGQARVGALKIDVEGFEPDVLSGAVQALSRTDALLIEISPELMAGGTAAVAALVEAIAAAGLSPDIWDRAGTMPSFAALAGIDRQTTVGFRRTS